LWSRLGKFFSTDDLKRLQCEQGQGGRLQTLDEAQNTADECFIRNSGMPFEEEHMQTREKDILQQEIKKDLSNMFVCWLVEI
jgi:hypothetical protein